MSKPIFVDMAAYPRIDHFHYFKSMAYPYVGTTCQVDITDFKKWLKKYHYPFFLSFLWCVARAANNVEQFRQRIREEQIVEYPFCPTSHTVAKEDDTYSYCTLQANQPFTQFLEIAIKQQQLAKLEGNIEEDSAIAESLLFVSTVPWLNYSSIIQPVPMPSDSNPRITWGKYTFTDQQLLMPVSVLCNHALVDGQHIGHFYQSLNDQLKQLIN